MDKSGPETAMVGETVTYNFTVTYKGSVPLLNVKVMDDIAGPATYVSGDDCDGLLEMNEVWVFSVNYTVLDTDSDPWVNTATS